MTFALVPAAGKSVRMGRAKLALPLGDRTVLERVVEALLGGGVEHVLVILGPAGSGLASLAERAGAHVLSLPEATPDMRATVGHGLSWLEGRFHPAADACWLLAPADHPTLKPDIVRQLLATHQAHPEASILIPTHHGRRGHPTLIAWKHVPGIQAMPPDLGLNVYLRQHPEETLEFPVDDPDILVDLDTPADYERLLGR